MELIVFILGLVITGAIFGALGRLAIPGPNPMSIGMTILVGIGGAFLGGLVALLVGADSVAVIWILQALGAALIVFLMQRRGGVRPRTY